MPLDRGEGEGFDEEYGDYAPVDEQPVIEEETEPEPETKHEPEQEYLPFDLAQARPSAFDPLKDGDSERVPLRDEEGEPLPEFDPRYAEDFHGLAFIGALSKTFEWMGHKFVIRTLSTDEMLAVAQITQKWENTIGSAMAYKTSMAALCTVSIDGRDLPVPIGASEDDFAWAYQRFNYAKARWFPFTIDAIYANYLELEEKTRKVVDAMGKASAPTDSTRGLSTNSV